MSIPPQPQAPLDRMQPQRIGPAQHLPLLQQQLQQLPAGPQRQLQQQMTSIAAPPRYLSPPRQTLPPNKRPVPGLVSQMPPPNVSVIRGMPAHGRPMEAAMPGSIVGPPPKRPRPNSSETIAQTQRESSLPIITRVQGGAAPAQTTKPSVPQISDQVTLTSVKHKEVVAKPANLNQNPQTVANILAHRGIIVTPTAKANETKKPDDNVQAASSPPVPDDGTPKQQINGAISITSVKKPMPSNSTIDLSIDEGPNSSATEAAAQPNSKFATIKCPYKACDKQFSTVETVRKHILQMHKLQATAPASRTIFKCKECFSKFSTQGGLTFHLKRMHSTHTPPVASSITDSMINMGIPVVNLADESTRKKLEELGIVNYIPMTNFNQSHGGLMALPILSIHDVVKKNGKIVQTFGTEKLLTVGRLKTIARKKAD